MTAVATPVHLVRDERGIIRVGGSRSKLTQVVRDHVGRGWSVAEIHEQQPHLSIADIHAALAYYFDHPAEVAAEMEREDRLVAACRSQTGISGLQRRLEGLKAEPHPTVR